MSRTSLRLFTVIAVMLAFTFTLLPAATEAQPLAGSHNAATHTNDLWSTALAWLASLLPGVPAAHSTTPQHVTSRVVSGPTGGYRTNTGPCIDPNGIRCTGT
jgi:hypothetical protein